MATIPAFSAPDWLKTETAEQIQARMMESLPPDIDDTEGGFPWDFTYPTALEKDELLNFHLVETLVFIFVNGFDANFMPIEVQRLLMESCTIVL